MLPCPVSTYGNCPFQSCLLLSSPLSESLGKVFWSGNCRVLVENRISRKDPDNAVQYCTVQGSIAQFVIQYKAPLHSVQDCTFYRTPDPAYLYTTLVHRGTKDRQSSFTALHAVLHTACCTLHITHCMMYTTHYLEYTLNCTLYSDHFTLTF